jgi:hypothetical protein
MNSILEKMKAAGIKLDDLKASAPSLPLADLKALNTALADEIRAKEAQTSKKTQRLARMAAAKAAAELNPAVERMITLANAELKRLDVKIDEFAVGGSVAKLDKLMAAANWPNLRKIQLKGTLHSIGVIE